MRGKELRERSNEELATLLNTARDELFQARIKNATHQLENTNSIRKQRREIARINTVLAERASANAPAAASEADGE